MTQDEIIGMAAVAGITFRKMTIDGEGYDYRYVDLNDNIGTDEAGCVERFAALVAAKAVAEEREACAQLAAQTVCDLHIPTGVKIYGSRAAKAIRARGCNV